MNIFRLDSNPQVAAQYHNDKHSVKMILEYTQMLSAAHRVVDGQQYIGKSKSGRNVKRWSLPDDRDSFLYNASFVNHPCTTWVRSSTTSYLYVYDLLVALHDEYTHRYGKVHKSRRLLDFLADTPYSMTNTDDIEPPQAMPSDVRKNDPVEAYREYYNIYKRHIASWTKREVPEWYRSEM